jgi:hypothetical protein
VRSRCLLLARGRPLKLTVRRRFAVDVLLIAVASVALALGASIARLHLGTKWFLVISAALVVCLLAVARYFPLVATATLNGRPFAFFRTQYLGYCFAVGAAATVVLAVVSSKAIMRVAIAAVAIFGIAWGGGFIT